MVIVIHVIVIHVTKGGRTLTALLITRSALEIESLAELRNCSA